MVETSEHVSWDVISDETGEVLYEAEFLGTPGLTQSTYTALLNQWRIVRIITGTIFVEGTI